MANQKNVNFIEENDFNTILRMVLRNYYLFIISIVIALGLGFLKNRYSIPVYQITSSLLIKEDSKQGGGGNVNDFLNSSLFGKNQNFQNELWVLQSTPVFEQTIKNLDLSVSIFKKEKLQDFDMYKSAPFRVLFVRDHVQPIGVRLQIEFFKGGGFLIKGESEFVSFYNYASGQYKTQKANWKFQQYGKFGKLIENQDLSFIIELDSTKAIPDNETKLYSFQFQDLNGLAQAYKSMFAFDVIDKKATVIKVSLLTQSVDKGIDLVNELMNVYSTQNLNRKNHIASITIDYIEKQLGEISDSLSMTEDNLQRFRSSNQLLDVEEQATGISAQYMNLQNQKAELMGQKRYYEYVADYLAKNDDVSKMIVPASYGIQDQILNNLMSELISAQAQRSNLIDNKQERNPLVKKLDIQIANIKKTISDNISAVRQTTNISIDEMNKRISRIEGQISNLPKTQRQLGGIERKYRLNDAIYNYLLEKRAEAKITKASNLPDDIIIEPALNNGPVSPNTKKIYMLALIIGIGLPLSFLFIKNALNDRLDPQDNIERLTDAPVVGKIMHNNKKTNNIMFEYPTSNIAESFRALRTNLDFYLKGGNKKVILVTSSIEGEGKSFNALNIAMSYAQLGKKTILLDFDLRKQSNYFNKKEGESSDGISSYLIKMVTLKDIILKTPHENLDYINSGPIPPNPAELIAMDETKNMIHYLQEKYDYIIIDSPPLAQVTDGFLLIDHADIKVIVSRYLYSRKKIFTLILKDLRQKKVENVCIVLNDNKSNMDQYGYGYGYNKKKK
ncbi:MAG: polysaccharide biosynthesis tyrosine autokinase [Bacteroidales bacterium]|nr:polysaccharide biosynthesis tyrosine autokinase [Bacteroidales bacterium]